MKAISKRVGVGLLSMIFLLALVSAMPVEAKTPLRWEYTANYTFEPEWTGVIVFDDGSSGTITLDIIDWIDLKNVQHFDGIWSITWDDGGYIKGTQGGKLVHSTSDYVINGKVTETSDNREHLNGRNIHIMGFIDYSGCLPATIGLFQIN